MGHTDLDGRLACVRHTWNPRQRLHVGSVAWADARGDGSRTPDSYTGLGMREVARVVNVCAGG